MVNVYWSNVSMAEIMKQPIEEELQEWRILKSFLIDYPCNSEQAKFNELIEAAPARVIVKFILDENKFLREQVHFYRTAFENLTK
jgi:hypothetical protein